MDETEIWRPICGYEGAYEVSNYGRVRSLTRTRMENNCHGGRSLRTDKGRILSPSDNGHGYKYVSLRKNGKKARFYVHRLVAESFIGRPKNENFVVDHLDHDRRNNAASNLEWITQKENVGRSKHLMRHPKKQWKVSSTGEKYITSYGNGFRVSIEQKGICRKFKNLRDAVLYRDEVIKGAE